MAASDIAIPCSNGASSLPNGCQEHGMTRMQSTSFVREPFYRVYVRRHGGGLKLPPKDFFTLF